MDKSFLSKNLLISYSLCIREYNNFVYNIIVMRIIVKDRRFGNSLKARYIVDLQIDYPSIPNNLKVTDRVLEQYKHNKSVLGYTSFRGLSYKDIVTILSAVKRGEATVNVNRMGHCAYYKLLNPNSNED